MLLYSVFEGQQYVQSLILGEVIHAQRAVNVP